MWLSGDETPVFDDRLVVFLGLKQHARILGPNAASLACAALRTECGRQ
jgi:hypothetical protein